MNEALLEQIIRKMHEEHQGDWQKVWKDLAPKIDDFKRLVLSGNATIESIVKWLHSLPREGIYLFRYLYVNWSQGEMFLKNNRRLVDIFKELQDAPPSVADDLFMNTLKLRGAGVSIITTWFAIFRPDLFLPIFGVRNQRDL